MLLRLVLIWLVLLVVAIVNGGFREAVLLPRLGNGMAHVISTLMLSAGILAVAWIATPWMAPRTLADAWTIGVTWLVLTLAFEFIAGHFAFGKTWHELLADYDILAGRIWLVVLIVTLLSPVLAFLERAGSRAGVQ
jgi:hypothetical protein